MDATICYNMNAPFLIDNSIDMALENFNYTQINMAQDLHDLQIQT